MIIGEIKGGLANQMFQYAFFKTIAKKTTVNCFSDLSFWNNDPIYWCNGIKTSKKQRLVNSINVFNIKLDITNEYDVTNLYKSKYPFYTSFILKNFITQLKN